MSRNSETSQVTTRATVPPSIGVLVSGRGSNLEAIFAAIRRGDLHARVGVVISSKSDVPALQIARINQVPIRVIVPKDYASRRAAGSAVIAALRDAQVALVVLAGYKPILDADVVAAYPLRIINIHPSLLPAFAGGMAPRPQTEALAAGVKITGCTVHFVTEAVDEGPIIAQAAVPVQDGDTVEELSSRILEMEHRILPRAIEDILHSTVKLEGRRVLLQPIPDHKTEASSQ
jgi:phosphoribosylglycinamide formyltransferase 1